MRELNEKQKELLDEWFKLHNQDVGLFFDISECDTFTLQFMQQLRDLNDYEKLYTDIERYLIDKII